MNKYPCVYGVLEASFKNVADRFRDGVDVDNDCDAAVLFVPLAR